MIANIDRGRPIQPQPVELTVKENSKEVNFPTKWIIIAMVAVFILAIGIYFRWRHMEVYTCKWETVKAMSLKGEDISAVRIGSGQRERHDIRDEKKIGADGNNLSYGLALSNVGYLSTGVLYQGKYPEIYIDQNKTHKAYIDIDVTDPDSPHIDYINVKR